MTEKKDIDLNKIEVSPETLLDINNIGDDSINRLFREKGLFTSEEEFKALSNPSYDLLGEKLKQSNKLYESYCGIIETFKKYVDMKEEYYPIVACWIIGTYFHNEFYSYPYLFFNATKGSGKTRTLSLISYFSKGGKLVSSSITEAVIFRGNGSLAIDECEKFSRKGNENLTELLNSAYKKGIEVQRMREVRKEGKKEQVIESFSLYRPLCLANIWGIDYVLEDRSLTLILEKSSKGNYSDLMELWETEEMPKKVKEILGNDVSDVTIRISDAYRHWNQFILSNTLSSLSSSSLSLSLSSLTSLYNKIKETGITGRMLELSFPLIIVANLISEEIAAQVISALSNLNNEKKDEEKYQNKDSLMEEMVAGYVDYGKSYFISIKKVTQDFREFIQSQEEWINEKWVSRALKRLNLILESKKTSRGREVILNIIKAQEKIK